MSQTQIRVPPKYQDLWRRIIKLESLLIHVVDDIQQIKRETQNLIRLEMTKSKKKEEQDESSDSTENS